MSFRIRSSLILLFSIILLPGCDSPEPVSAPSGSDQASSSTPPQSQRELMLGTTTTVQDSGLLDVLMKEFETQSGIKTRTVVGGSGEVLELGKRGDADILLTHSKSAEEAFVKDGWATERVPFMFSDFVLLGPESDPAKCREAASASEALRLIQDAKRVFVSRGDNSGTHAREKKLREKIGGDAPASELLLSMGAGMGETLRVASEKQAYTLCDRPTFLALRKTLQLSVVFEGGPDLRNDYAILPINPQKHSHVNADAARKLLDFLTSDQTAALIVTFGTDKFGQPVFTPVARDGSARPVAAP